MSYPWDIEKAYNQCAKYSYYGSDGTLNFSNYQINSLPRNLPKDLRTLVCSGTMIEVLSNLPDSLEYLECNRSWHLKYIKCLPPNLRSFQCITSVLQSLVSLPNSLQTCIIRQTNLHSLPPLPSDLIRLDCSHNGLTYIGKLPYTLRVLNISHTGINHLPPLPYGLIDLDVSHTPLTEMPDLSDCLEFLNCAHTNIKFIPTLNRRLRKLDISNTRIRSLPSIPNSLNIIHCSAEFLDAQFEIIPANLIEIGCTCTQDPGTCFSCYYTAQSHPKTYQTVFPKWKQIVSQQRIRKRSMGLRVHLLQAYFGRRNAFEEAYMEEFA
jgi:hypothetical protein